MERIENFLNTSFKHNALGALYSANFFLALHLFLVVYINSSYLSTFIKEGSVGLVYVGGSAVGLFLLVLISKILSRFGSARTLIALTVLEFLIFIGLAFPGNSTIAILLFIAYLATYPLILLSLDIFLEHSTTIEETTGSVRGTFLTISNTALVISPLLAGFILDNNSYWRVFLISAFFLIPFLLIIIRLFRVFKEPDHSNLKILPTFACLRKNRAILTIFKAHFIMRLFFAWMVIYTPIYLHNYIGFNWQDIGVIFTIMLLPYLLFELPAGKLADGWLGEKELMTVGFVITALSVGLMSFVATASIVLWSILLFMTRTGAALLEVMTETYFFKHVSGNDLNTISCFRMIRPLAYIAGSLLGTVALFIVDIQYVFLIFSGVILYGLRYSLSLTDTK